MVFEYFDTFHDDAGTSNTNLGGAKYEFGGMYFVYFTVNTAKYSPKYFRSCKYGPYLGGVPAMTQSNLCNKKSIASSLEDARCACE